MLNSVFDLGLKAITARDAERTAAQQQSQALVKARPAIDKAREALLAMTVNELELGQSPEPPPQQTHEKAQAKFEAARTELAKPQDDLAAASARLSAAKYESVAADRALATAIDSCAFNFAAMSTTDLAKLKLLLVDNPSLEMLLHPSSAGQITNAFTARFANPDQDTIDAMARAPQDEAISRALATAVTGMKPEALAALFMKVQDQPNRLDNHADPFIGKILDKIGDIDLRTMHSLGVQLDGMTQGGRDTYINQLDKKIAQSIIAVARDDSKDPEGRLKRADAFDRCNKRFAAHAESWSELQLAKPEQGRKPFLASLTTTELVDLFNAVHADAGWSATDSGRNGIALVTTLFSQRLMSTDINTPQAMLDKIAEAASSTSYVASLTPAQVGRLFALLQENAGAWRKASAATFTAKVNSRFVHDFFPSLRDAAPDERQRWSTILGNLGQQWKGDVAGAVEQAAIAATSLENKNQQGRELNAVARAERATARTDRLAQRQAREAERQNSPETAESISAREADKKQETADAREAEADMKGPAIDASRHIEQLADAEREMASRQFVAVTNTPIGTLGVDDAAELFLANQGLAGIFSAEADELTEALATKFVACYPQVKLDTHQRLIDSFSAMTEEGQRIFTAAANRPPSELLPLLEQVFKQINGLLSQSQLDEQKLPTAFERIVEYHSSLPGPPKSDAELLNWLSDALPRVNATNSMLRALNSSGPLRDAWLAPKGNLGRYLVATARATETLVPEQWQDWSARISVAHFFAGQKAWSPALQQHFDRLLKLKPPVVDAEICTSSLSILKARQAVQEKKGLSQREVKKIINTFINAGTNKSRQRAFQNFDMERLEKATDAERLQAIRELFGPLVRQASNELLDQGMKAYKKMK